MSLSDHKPFQRLIRDEPSEHDLEWLALLHEMAPSMKALEKMEFKEAREMAGLIALRVRHTQ